MARIKDIADKLGIAVSTVSKGLNGADDISEDLRKVVLDTAVEMGYVTKRMRKEEHKKLCIFVENMDYENVNDFGYDIILGFRQMAARDNWSIDLVPITPAIQASEKYDSYMLRNGYMGGFLVGFSLHDDWMLQMQTAATPTVLLDNYITRNPNVGYVGTDSYEGIDLCVSHLAQLGHTKIALLNGSRYSMVTTHRHEAFLNSMAANQLEVNENLIDYGYYVSDCAKYIVPGFLEHGATAIVCSSDLIALGVIEECRLRGFSVPEDISVTGFDDLPIALNMVPPLTTIKQDRLLLGKSGYNTLAALQNQLPISKTTLRAQLILRSSTAPLQKKARKNLSLLH